MPVLGPEAFPVPRDTVDDSCPEACLAHGICVRACGGSLVDDMEEEFECRFCGRDIAESECEGWDMHCPSCRDDGRCKSCNGAPSVKP
jgi:hypothetical protein